MSLDAKQVHDLNNMNRAAQNAGLGDIINEFSEGSGYVLPAAQTSTLGGVKQAVAVSDSSGATDSALEGKFNELLASLRAAGILANG